MKREYIEVLVRTYKATDKLGLVCWVAEYQKVPI
ncbi:hypothetical protein BC742_2753 [Coprobacter fastidiosus NSB1 = JCM 33896]|uniref:Uncharacterized protein n=1 Tax=Coprobacter fastidiosus NSB1 = JCM 33896 TaxID=1349822 RepID=A0A495VIK3_9BACT|nr:hypothetical protein BC742_2753 [Coprobacter fastidiosus NSB1 = JCM 33896]